MKRFKNWLIRLLGGYTEQNIYLNRESSPYEVVEVVAQEHIGNYEINYDAALHRAAEKMSREMGARVMNLSRKCFEPCESPFENSYTYTATAFVLIPK